MSVMLKHDRQTVCHVLIQIFTNMLLTESYLGKKYALGKDMNCTRKYLGKWLSKVIRLKFNTVMLEKCNLSTQD